MRTPTPEALRSQKLALARLEQDWERLNRPHVDRGLKISLYTRIMETRALVGAMEARLNPPAKGARPRGREDAAGEG